MVLQKRDWSSAAGASVTGKGRRSGPQWPWNGARFPEHPKAMCSQSLARGLCLAEDEPSDGAGPLWQPAAQSPGAQPAGGEEVLTLAEAADYLKINDQRAAELVRRSSSRTVRRRDRQDEEKLTVETQVTIEPAGWEPSGAANDTMTKKR